MIRSLLGVLILCAAAAAVADDTGHIRSIAKHGGHVLQNPGTPDGREGGENISAAIPIPAFPFADTGNTCDNLDDYDETCPYVGSTSADVVYSFLAPNDLLLSIDLCGSGYDTKVYVYCEGPGGLIACNDDYYFPGNPCGDYVSYLSHVSVFAGFTYYIVIDGYGGDCGDYLLDISEYSFVPSDCAECPPYALAEGEPDMVEGYVDLTNGGCNSDPADPPFTLLEGTGSNCVTVCCNSGWYVSSDGLDARDTDWFLTTAAGAEVSMSVMADFACDMYQLSISSCDDVTAIFSGTAPACELSQLTVPTTPGEIIFLWVGPDVFEPPPGAPPGALTFTYLLEVCGIVDSVIPAARTSWGQVKALYR